MSLIAENKIINCENNNDENCLSVPEFYANKNIFITGGTGFLGTVLIEALLSAHPDVGIIYVLVRGKRGLDPHERIKRLLRKPLFDQHEDNVLEKVIPVVGELSEKNFGFNKELLDELLDKVSVIFHCAATIKYVSPLRNSIDINVTATLRTIEFAKQLKTLSTFVHFSTAFCNSNRQGLIDESVYKSDSDPYEMIKMAADDQSWIDFTPEKLKSILKGHPNTYTFTKNLAENLIMSEMSGMPTCIVRPSTVYGTLESPVKGWVGNANSGHLGFLTGYVKGIFRTMRGIPTLIVDLIPCDYVINSSLAAGWYVGTRKLEKPEVIHCTSGEVNPLNLADLEKYLNESTARHPPDYFVWLPYTKLRNGWRYKLFYYLSQVLPAYIYLIPERVFKLGMSHHTALEYTQVFDRAMKAFDFFLHKDFRYSLKNALKVMDSMNPVDQKRYNFDCTHCDWSEFMDSCIIGIRRFYFKESIESTGWHHFIYRFYVVLYWLAWLALFLVILTLMTSMFSAVSGFAIALALWCFLYWL